MTLASTLTRPVPIYREEQNFGWWVYGMLAVMAGVGIVASLWKGHVGAEEVTRWSGQVPLVLAIGLIVPAVLVIGVLRMTTEVTPNNCRVWFGWVPTFHHVVPLLDIVKVEVVDYRPIFDCGGWGIRRSRNGERVFNARGNRGVRLELVDGSRVLIGSQSPVDLARALEQGIRPTVVS